MMTTTHQMNVPEERIHNQPRFGMTVDVVIFGYCEDLKVLTIESDMKPYKGLPSLLGDIISPNERLVDAAARILKHYTGMEGLPLEQLGAFDELDRHPLGRVITIGFFSLIRLTDDDLSDHTPYHAKWVPVKDIHDMAFDHKQILNAALQHVRSNIDLITQKYGALPEAFTLSKLQHFHEVILGESLDRRNFRKRIMNQGYVRETGKLQTNVSHRPAKLFKLTGIK